MNKYQEALDYQTSKLLECAYSLDNEGLVENIDEGLKKIEKNKELLQELVDKETPTKPVVLEEAVIALTIDGKKTISRIYGCPKCKHMVNFPHKRCDECGQALDWSDK